MGRITSSIQTKKGGFSRPILFDSLGYASARDSAAPNLSGLIVRTIRAGTLTGNRAPFRSAGRTSRVRRGAVLHAVKDRRAVLTEAAGISRLAGKCDRSRDAENPSCENYELHVNYSLSCLRRSSQGALLFRKAAQVEHGSPGRGKRLCPRPEKSPRGRNGRPCEANADTCPERVNRGARQNSSAGRRGSIAEPRLAPIRCIGNCVCILGFRKFLGNIFSIRTLMR